MIRVNVVYEYDYDDVDIILLPDSLANSIDKINFEFGGYISPNKDDKDYWRKSPDGKLYSILETEGLVKWINRYWVKDGEKAVIEQQHVAYNPEYEMMDF